MKQGAAKGHTAKHAGGNKHVHHHHAKHHPKKQKKAATHHHAHHHQKVHTVAKGHKGAKPGKQGLALGQAVACCSAEAVAASLRLTGRAVSAWDVLALYRHTADGPDVFTSIPETLEAAYAYGLAGVRPVSFGPVGLDDPAARILGVDLPGPHAVCAGGGQWWSWGERWCPCCFPDAVLEEAWAVTWP